MSAAPDQQQLELLRAELHRHDLDHRRGQPEPLLAELARLRVSHRGQRRSHGILSHKIQLMQQEIRALRAGESVVTPVTFPRLDRTQALARELADVREHLEGYRQAAEREISQAEEEELARLRASTWDGSREIDALQVQFNRVQQELQAVRGPSC